VWTGFVQAPTDLGDVHHGLAETGIQDDVIVSLASPAAPHEEQLAAMDRGIALAGDDALLVLFAETGRETAVDERLPALAARGALTLVVAPLDGSAEPPAPKGSPYLASIAFDIERARAGRWPAISSASWSKVADDDIAALADRARRSPSDALDDYLCQPFYVAEPFLAPGEHVPVRDLRAEVERVLAQAAV
jgi:hypothetical protein